MIFNFIALFIYTLLLPISLLGYGTLIFNYINTNNTEDSYYVGEKAFYSLLFFIPLSLIIHFFFSFNYFITTTIFIIGILMYLKQNNLRYKFNTKKTIYFFLLLFLFIPYFILTSYHDDFYYYHLPYLNVLQHSKIIFGLANLNTVLTYPQNLWFDIFALFKLPIIEHNGLQSFNGIFTLFFIIYCIENFIKAEKTVIKIISILYVVFSLSLFSRLRDHGAEIIPQLLMLMCYLNIMKIWINEDSFKSRYLINIIIFFTLAFLLRLSSVILIPLIAIILIQNNHYIYEIIKKIKFISLILLIVSTVMIKNLITSGCVVYPISKTCLSQNIVPWSIDKEIPKINENVILSFTRGWVLYAKINTANSNKFIFNPSKNILSHKDYLSKGVKFWLKYWAKDADIKRIFNIIYIGIITILIFTFVNIRNFELAKKKKKNLYDKFFQLMYLISPMIFWLFFSTPSNRYGGYAIFIAFFSYVIANIIILIYSQKINYKLPLLILISISCLFFSIKNISRINNDMVKNNFAWPKLTNLKLGIDYQETTINKTKVYLRIPTNILIMGKITDTNNYILHCGNINMLCTPIKKRDCIKDIQKKYGYIFIYGNKEKCLELHNKNALY